MNLSPDEAIGEDHSEETEKRSGEENRLEPAENDNSNNSENLAENAGKGENNGEDNGEGKGEDNGEENGEESPAPAKFNWKKELLDWLIIFAAAFALAYALTHFVIIKTEVISGSMISTLNVDDHVVANRLAYVFSKPKRGDIIFFAYPDDESKTYVKRIIGLPGEKVEIIKGKVYINDSDEPLEEPYLNEKMKKENFGPYYVPEGCYFVMGDNRNISVDSRYWDNKFVTYSEIYGKAWFRYRPNLQIIHGAKYPEETGE
ncbi:MAG: signal peptidase I [Lachnospiraceae bacterium]|nr:signal peptidase I [Lachnospiraceae bacterium]